MAIACTVGTFDINETVDEHGNRVIHGPEFNPGIIV